jgi:hypothetical protein
MLLTGQGKDVEAAFLDRNGHLQRVAGRVARSEAGELVVESWVDGVRKETAVTRDASVSVRGG